MIIVALLFLSTVVSLLAGSYVVGEHTRPVLTRLRLAVTYPVAYGEEILIEREFDPIAIRVAGGLALLGAIATVVAVVRVSRQRHR